MTPNHPEFWWETLETPVRWTEPLVQRALETLALPDWHARNAFATWLQRWMTEPVIDALLRALRDQQNANRRNTAIQVLGTAGRYLLPRLQRYLQDEDDDVRLFATQLAGTALQPSLLPMILQRLQDPNPNVRLAAVEALGRYGVPQGVEALRRILDEEDTWTQFQVVLSLGRTGHPEGLSAARSWKGQEFILRAYIQGIGGYIYPEAFHDFVDWFAQEPSPQKELPHTLPWFEPELPMNRYARYIDVFHEWLRRIPPETLNLVMHRTWSAWLTSSREDVLKPVLYWGALFQVPEVLDYVFHKAHQPQWCENHTLVLAWVGAADLQTWLRLWYTVETPDVRHVLLTVRPGYLLREEAGRGIREVWDELDPDSQGFVLESVLPDPAVHTAVPWEWLELGWRTMQPSLNDICRQWMLRHLAGERRRAEWHERAQSWSHVEEPWRRAVALEIRTYLEPEGLPALMMEALQDPHPWVRYVAVLCLQDTPADQIQLRKEAARLALTDEHPGVREAAIRMYPEDDPDLLRVLDSMLEDEELWVRIAALRRWAESRRPGGLDKLLDAYRLFPDLPLRSEILRLIGNFPEQRVLDFYRDVFDEAPAPLRIAVAEGVGRLHDLKDLAYPQAEEWFHRLPDEEHSTRLRLLGSMAALDPERFDAWFPQVLDRLELLHRPEELLSVLDAWPQGPLPDWAVPWLFVPAAWVGWFERLPHHSEWLPRMIQNAPWRFRRLLEIAFPELLQDQS